MIVRIVLTLLRGLREYSTLSSQQAVATLVNIDVAQLALREQRKIANDRKGWKIVVISKSVSPRSMNM